MGGKDDQHTLGYKFSMAEFAADQRLRIEGTKLFTLSACQTAAENKRDDGVVMEGMSEAVLEKGAESVISSLWSADDAATSALMVDFYQHWVGSNGKLTKIDALRQAELDLLYEKIKPQPNDQGSTGPSSFANPYYWAPFVLAGNWQ
jgi:CHAT domain-containing protein